jgi:hypothetical protein
MLSLGKIRHFLIMINTLLTIVFQLKSLPDLKFNDTLFLNNDLTIKAFNINIIIDKYVVKHN